MSDQMIFKRYEIKYMLTREQKRRIWMTEAEAVNYLLHREKITDSQIAREIDYCLDYYRELTPKVLLSYEREAFYHKADHNLRITFDETILWRDYDVDLMAFSS